MILSQMIGLIFLIIELFKKRVLMINFVWNIVSLIFHLLRLLHFFTKERFIKNLLQITFLLCSYFLCLKSLSCIYFLRWTVLLVIMIRTNLKKMPNSLRRANYSCGCNKRMIFFLLIISLFKLIWLTFSFISIIALFFCTFNWVKWRWRKILINVFIFFMQMVLLLIYWISLPKFILQ